MNEDRRESEGLTPEQLQAVVSMVSWAVTKMTAILAGVGPALAAAAERARELKAQYDLPREPVDLHSLQRALSDGATELPLLRFDQEGKFRGEPSMN